MSYNFADRNNKTILHSWGRFRGTLLEDVVVGDLLALKAATSTSLQFADDVTGQAAIAVACQDIEAGKTGWCALAVEIKAPTTIGTGGVVTQQYFDDGTDVDIGQALYLDDEGKADDTVGATTLQQVGYNVSRDRILLVPGGMLTGAATFTTLLCTGAVSMTSTVAMTGVVTLSDATESTSSTTGALKIAGGVGIAKDLFVGVDLAAAGTLGITGATTLGSTLGVTGAVTIGTTSKLCFTDTNAFIHANQSGSVWIQGSSSEYGIYLRAPNSEIRVDQVLHFVAHAAVYTQIGGFWFDSDDKCFHYWDGGERTLAALQLENVFTENQRIATDNRLEFLDATAYIFANQAGSVWISGASAEYGIYLSAANSEIRVDNVLHFVARTLYNQLGSLWFDSGDLKFHYWDGGEKTIDSSAA